MTEESSRSSASVSYDSTNMTDAQKLKAREAAEQEALAKIDKARADHDADTKND